jgi:hypothetical protein
MYNGRTLDGYNHAFAQGMAGQKSQLGFCQSMIKCATNTREEWAISD